MNREEHIAFEMNYCQHYGSKEGSTYMDCKAGMNLKETQTVLTTEGIKWGPCIGGHVLANPHEHCPHWIRRTREMGEKRADSLARAMERMAVVSPVVNAWRDKPPKGKQETIECPACKGRLHLSQAACNGHIRAYCETAGCVAWME